MTTPIAVYGDGTYGGCLYGSTLGLLYNARLAADSTEYGEVKLTWGYPLGDWSMFRIVRNPNGFPVHADDGIILDVDVESYVYDDPDVTSLRRYYYSAFVYRIDTQEWVRSGDAQTIVVKDFSTLDAMWKRVPHMYKNSDALYHFLSIFAYQLDTIRSEFATLLDITHLGRASISVLPSMLAQLGFEPEPELEGVVVRRLVANAAYLYGLKGLPLGAENLVTLFTGWDCELHLGYNRLLDNLDTLTGYAPGRWVANAVNCSIRMRVADSQVTPPHSDTYAVVTATAPGPFSVSFAEEGLDARMNGVPVLEGQHHIAVVHIKGTGLIARLALDWYDRDGYLIDTTLGTPIEVVNEGEDFALHLECSGFAPATSATVGLRVISSAAYPDQELFLHAAMLEETNVSSSRPWRPARELLFVMRADLVNEVDNPDGTSDTDGWADSLGLASGTDGFVYTWGM